MQKSHLIEVGGLAVLVVVLLMFYGLSGGKSLKMGGGNPAPAPVQVQTTPIASQSSVLATRTFEIIDHRLSPETLVVKPGERIAFFNKDQSEHELLSEDQKTINTGKLQLNQTSILVAPEKPGNYGFASVKFPQTKGTLVVQK